MMVKKLVSKFLPLAVTALFTHTLIAAPKPDIVVESFADGLTVTGGESGAVYTLALGEGNSINADGQIEIGAESQVGATFTADRSLGTKITVLVKYAAMPVSDAAVVSVFEKKEDGTEAAYPGARWRNDSAADLVGFYEDSQAREYFFSSGGGGADNSSPDPTASGYLMFSYDLGSGSACYAGADQTQLAGGYVNALRFGSGRKNYGFAVGGPYTDTYYPACAGMKIEKIAVFLDQYHAGTAVTDYADFVWPSEFATATISESMDFENIPWSSDVALGRRLTVENNPTITISSPVEFSSLEIVGDCTIVAGDAFYEEGCSLKPLISTDSLTVNGTITAGALKDGYHAAIVVDSQMIALRTQTKEVISINLTGGKAGGSGSDSEATNVVSGDAYYGLAPVPGNTWNNINRRWQSGGTQTVTLNAALAYDGDTRTTRTSMKLSATAKNTWQDDSIENPFLRGYLDDGNGVTVNVTGIPYETYDVIIYATSDSDLKLAPITVNGVTYTFKDGATVVDEGTTAWGVGRQATPVFGKNALLVTGQKRQDLTISSTRMDNGAGPRATLCAVQIINMGGEVLNATIYTKTVPTTETEGALTTIAYDQGTLVSSELNDVELTFEGTAEDEPYALTFDQADTKLGMVKIKGARPLALTTVAGISGIPEIDLSEYTGTLTVLSVDHVNALRLKGNIACSGTVTKAGTGTITFAGANTFPNLIIEAGLAKSTTATGFGANNYESGDLATITVADGATLDLAGSSGTSYAITIAGDGVDGNGALVNCGDDIGSTTRQTAKIALSADASVGGRATFGLLAHEWGPSTLDLGAYTLTKKGGNTLILCNTTVNGTGLIAIEAGTVWVVHGGVNAAEATIDVGEAGALNLGRALTVKNLKMSGGSTITGEGALTVTGERLYGDRCLNRINAITGEPLTFGYAFRGIVDGDWTNTANWFGVNASATEWVAYPTDRNAPHRRQRDDGSKLESFYDPVLIDGNYIALAENRTVTVGQLEGWNPRIGVAGGAKVTVAGTGKWQTGDNGDKWLYVEGEGSQLRMTAGNPDVPVYCATEDGLFYDRTVNGGSVQYYLKGAGTVKYLGLTGGTHIFKRFDFAIGDATKTRGIVSKKLVSVPNTSVVFKLADDCAVTITDAAAHEGVTARSVSTLAGDEALGSYTIVTKNDGVYVKYIGYGDAVEQPVPKLTGAGALNWEDAANWTTESVPMAGEAIVEATGDLTLTVSDAITLDTLTVTATADDARVMIVGESFTAAKIVVGAGATYRVTCAGQYTHLDGDGTVVFDPGAEAELTLSGENAFRGQTVVASGTVKMSHANNFGPQNKAVDKLIVKSGATLDVNGVTSNQDYNSERIGVTLEEGAVLTNTGTAVNGVDTPVSRVTLLGNATICVPEGKTLDLGRVYNWGSSLAIGSFTLSKTGTGELVLGYTGCTGDGMIDIAEGTVSLFPQYNNDVGLNALQATVKIAKDAVVELCYYSDVSRHALLSAKNLIVDGTVRQNNSEGSVVVNGSLSGTGTIAAPLTFGRDAVIKPNGAAAITVGGTVTLAEDDTVALDLEGLDLSKLSSIPVLKATDAANLPAADRFTGVPVKWSLVASSDGKTLKLMKSVFVISIK